MIKASDFTVGFFITAIALFFFFCGASVAIKEDFALRNYLPIDALVNSSEIKVVPPSSTSKSRRPTYRPAISFQYEVDGQRYISDNGQMSKISIGYKDYVRQIVERYHPGQHYIAYYAPKDPSKAFLVREHNFIPYMILLFSMPFLTFGVAMLAYPVLSAKWAAENELPESDSFRLERTKQREFNSYLAISMFWFGIGGSALIYYFVVAEDFMHPMQLVTTLMYCGFGLLPLKAAVSSLRLSRQARNRPHTHH